MKNEILLNFYAPLYLKIEEYTKKYPKNQNYHLKNLYNDIYKFINEDSKKKVYSSEILDELLDRYTLYESKGQINKWFDKIKSLIGFEYKKLKKDLNYPKGSLRMLKYASPSTIFKYSIHIFVIIFFLVSLLSPVNIFIEIIGSFVLTLISIFLIIVL